jgi:hypothetical protein
MANNLPLTTIELVSVQGAVPLNGSPTSQTYNDNQNNCLIDLAAIVSFLNGVLEPLLQVLPANAADDGIEGRAINTDITDLTPLCYNALTATPLTIAQSLVYLQSIIASLQGQMTDIATQVAVLASQLSATNQNDISLALQNFQTMLNEMMAMITNLQNEAVSGGAPVTVQFGTPSIAPKAIETVAVSWASPFINNTYTAVCSIEDPTGFLSVDSWSYGPSGSGIVVVVKNSDTAAAHIGVIHAVAYLG